MTVKKRSQWEQTQIHSPRKLVNNFSDSTTESTLNGTRDSNYEIVIMYNTDQNLHAPVLCSFIK